MASENEAPASPAPKKKAKRKTKRTRAKRAKATAVASGMAKYPRHTIEKVLRIPKAIIEQNAGKKCSEREAATYAGVGMGGPFRVEISSSIKYGFLSRPRTGVIAVTDRARQAIRPQKPGDDINALRQAVLEAPEISEVYKHYRGEDLPDGTFFENALVDKFRIPADKVAEFRDIFLSSLKSAHLIEERGDKFRILDVTSSDDLGPETSPKKGPGPKIGAGDSCFVVMPFAGAIGGYFHAVYEPAIKKAGLAAVRADADILEPEK